MAKLKILSGTKIIRILEKLGFEKIRQKGSHIVLKKILKDGKQIGCVVPLHKEVAIGTLKNILRQVNLTTDDFLG